MIIKNNGGYLTNSLFPNSDWTGEAIHVLEDDSELANKLVQYYPYYNLVIEEEEIVDVVQRELTTDELLSQQAQENALTPIESTIASLTDLCFSLMDDIDALKGGA